VIVSRRNAWAGAGLLVVLMVVTLLPFASLFTTALHESGTYPRGLDWPSHPHWHNFVEAFHVANMATIFKSSVLIVIGVVPVTVLIATMAGFAIGELRIRGGQFVFLLFLLGLTLPFEGVIVPLYYEVRGMGLLNTRWAIILPLIGLFMPFGVFWMRAHFLNMPSELSEAARVDGATTWQLFWAVHVPLARPAVVSLGILTTVWTWNQFLLAIVLVDDPTKRTMAGALGAFQGQWGTNIPLLSAGSLLILTPTIIVFFVFQRHFVSALLQGSLKG
jgi:raffinose/stachyose/melibiose transport system permease protein